MEAVRTLLDILFPRTCAGCGQEPGSAAGHTCWDCQSSVEVIAHPFCSRCGNPLQGRSDHAYTCYHCNENPPHFDLARSAAHFTPPVSGMIRDLKYHQAVWVADDLADILAACVSTHYADEAFDAVVPVPLFPARERARGHNQAVLLGRALCRRIDVPCVDDALIRVKDTATQTHLTARKRASNVSAAFTVRRPAKVRDRRILLVDDVMTTGATLNECSRALKEAGAVRVLAATLARGG